MPEIRRLLTQDEVESLGLDTRDGYGTAYLVREVPEPPPLTVQSYPVAWMEDIQFTARLYLENAEGNALRRWNGWVEPAFDRANVDAIRAFMDAHHDEHAYQERYEWAEDDGNVLLTVYDDAELGTDHDPGFIDEFGVRRWAVGAGAWTWYRVREFGS